MSDDQHEAAPPPSAEATKSRPDADFNPVGEIGATLRRVHSRYMTSLLVAYCVAAGVGVGTVLLNPVRDWILFLAMFLVILVYIIAYIKAHQRGRRVLRFLGLVTTEGLLAFWAFILVDRIPARKVFTEGRVEERGDMPLLWVSVALLGVVGLGLLLHWLWIGRMSAPRQAAPGETTA